MSDSSQVQADIRALVGTQPQKKTLPDLSAAAPVDSVTGVAKPKSPLAASGGGSVTGDLTEYDYIGREWHPVEIITSIDGFFHFEVRRIKKIKMTDAAGVAHALIFAPKP